MKNQADYSLYKCPYSHLEKDCGHELHGPEGYENTYGVWCACGFRGPVFCLDPDELKLEKKYNKAFHADQKNLCICGDDKTFYATSAGCPIHGVDRFGR